MASGGRRPGAGRPKKAAAQKILEGNPGRREIEVVTFNAEGVELPRSEEHTSELQSQR